MDNNLYKIIKKKGIKISWVADKSGISRNTMTGLHNGQIPHLDLAYKISKAIGVSVYDIWPNLEELKD